MDQSEATPIKKPRTKTELVQALAETTGLGKGEVTKFFSGLAELIRQDLGQEGAGEFTIPGLMKIKVVRKPATEAREGINPFTKEKMIFKAKPARNVVKITPLKGLKEMV